MPEQVYIDLTPGLVDVPASTWGDIDPDELTDFMLRQVPEELRENVASQGLCSVIRAMRTPEIGPQARELLSKTSSGASLLNRLEAARACKEFDE